MPQPWAVADKPRYRLKLKSLKFVSAVDRPAQETATVLLTKRAAGEFALVSKFARVVKTDDELGLVFAWAVTSQTKGEDYYDLQDDNLVADDEFIKVAAEFMENGGATDQMHDRNQDGRVVFAMPMTPEIAKAFGVQADTYGLMVALKPSPEVFAKFKSGEYTGLSIDGTGVRTPVGKSAWEPQRPALLTDVEGHSHLIDLNDNGGSTTSETSEGAEYSHSHSWIRTMDGQVLIGASEGHSHEVRSDGSGISNSPAGGPSMVATENDMTTAAKTAEHVAAETELASLKTEVATLKSKLTASEDKAKSLQTDLDLQKRIALLPESERSHIGCLADGEVVSFLAKSATDRAKEIEAAIVYKAGDGTVYRKGEEKAAGLAKRLDDETAKRIESDNKAKEADLAKRAGEMMQYLPGDAVTQVSLLKRIEAETDTTKRDAELAILRAGNEGAKLMFQRHGSSVAKVADDPNTQLEQLAKKYAEDNKVPYGKAYLAVCDTPVGKALFQKAAAISA